MIKKITELLPILSLVLIFISYNSLSNYYSKFNIAIYSYIEPSEILLSFLPILIPLIQIAIATFLILLGLPSFLKFIENFEQLHRKIFLRFSWGIWIISVIFLIGRSFFKHYLFHKGVPIWYEIVANLSSISWAIFTYLNIDYKIVKRNAWIIILIPVYFIGISYLDGLSADKAINIIEYGESDVISFKYHEKYISSDTLNTFIGQTHNFLFLYDRRYKLVHVYKKDSMDSIALKSF